MAHALSQSMMAMGVTARKRLNSPDQPTGEWCRKDKRLGVYRRDGFTCLICMLDLHDVHSREITLDHYRPRHHGGSNHESNLFTACRSCNSSRQTKPVPRHCRARVRAAMRRSIAPHRVVAKTFLIGCTWDVAIDNARRESAARSHCQRSVTMLTRPHAVSHA